MFNCVLIFQDLPQNELIFGSKFDCVWPQLWTTAGRMSIFDCQYTSVVVTAGFDILSASNSRFSPSHLSSMLSIVLVLSIVVVVPVAPHILPGSVENFRFPIHVRNNGGEVFSEVITSNPSQNYISIDFEDTDGSHIKQLADFQNVSLPLGFIPNFFCRNI